MVAKEYALMEMAVQALIKVDAMDEVNKIIDYMANIDNAKRDDSEK